MGPRSIANYVFIILLAAALAAGLYASYSMLMAAMS
jgi:hypothetical protein